MRAKRLADLVPKGADAVYARTSRRGFLAKASAALAAVGLGEMGVAASARADPLCCTGTSCGSLGLECGCGNPSPMDCPRGWRYTGYTWACCLQGVGKLFLCRDCLKNHRVCVCGCASDYNCQSTMTELAASGITLTPSR